MAGAEHDPMRPVRPDGSEEGLYLPAPPAEPARVEAAWAAAVAAFRAAEADCDAALAAGDEDRLDRCDARADRAFDAMLDAPAPSVEALADKIGLLAADGLWEMAGGGACLSVLAADTRRLAALAEA